MTKCPSIVTGNFFYVDKKCKCGWGEIDDENVLKINEDILIKDLLCSFCGEKTYFLSPLLTCKTTNKLCIEYDCDLYL